MSAGVSCTQKKSGPSEMSSVDQKVDSGRRIYAIHCTSCHNANPKLDGAIGPSVVPSSLQLLERRVVYGDYPVDYKPKRQSRIMVALPHLKNEVEALHAYLSQL